MAEQLNNKAAPASAPDQAESISKQASPDQAESTINQTQPAQEESTAKQSPSSQDKSTTKQEPLDLPFPDIDFDFIQKEIDQVKVDNAKKAEKKTSQSNNKGYFSYKLTYMFLSWLLVIIIGICFSASPVSDPDIYYHPLCLAFLCGIRYWDSKTTFRNLGIAVAYNGSVRNKKFERWFYKNSREDHSRIHLVGYGLFAGLMIFAYIIHRIPKKVNMEPASFEAYLALIFAGLILAGLWFALFLIANPSYVKIGKDVDETETFFVKVSSSSKTNTSSKTSASSKSRTSTQDHATGEEKGEAGEKEVSYQLEWWEKSYKLDHPDFMAYTVKADCKSKYSEKCIRLATSPEEEPQEFDHLYLTSFGLIAIETKNYAGNIEVVNDGSWKVNGKIRQSPSNQVRRHNVVLQTILKGKNIPLYSFICFANEETEII